MNKFLNKFSFGKIKTWFFLLFLTIFLVLIFSGLFYPNSDFNNKYGFLFWLLFICLVFVYIGERIWRSILLKRYAELGFWAFILLVWTSVIFRTLKFDNLFD